MAANQQELASRRRPTVVTQLPYEDIRAALSFLERAFGFHEVATSRMANADGRILPFHVEVANSETGIGSQGAHGAASPKTTGSASQYISVYIHDIDAHHERALAAGARIDRAPHAHARDYRVYEGLASRATAGPSSSGYTRCRSGNRRFDTIACELGWGGLFMTLARSTDSFDSERPRSRASGSNGRPRPGQCPEDGCNRLRRSSGQRAITACG